MEERERKSCSSKGQLMESQLLSRPMSTYYFGILILLTNLVLICDCNPESRPSTLSNIEIYMPNVRPLRNDDYYCTAKNVEEYGTAFIYKFEPKSTADRAHHIILYACDDVPHNLMKDGWWDCGHHYQACNSMRIIYAWAKNAPPTVLPENVGLRIGPESNTKNIVLQVHYAHALPEHSYDRSGFILHFTRERPKFLAGVMLMFRSHLDIPPEREKIHGDMNCELSTNRPIHPFAYRVHTHKLGTVVSGFVFNTTTGFRLIGKGNPQWPQAFYPTKKILTVNPGEAIAARCTYSTQGYGKSTSIGGTAADEMCNMYIMYYTDSRNPKDHSLECGDNPLHGQISDLPWDSDQPLPRNRTLEEHAMSSHMDQVSTTDKTPVNGTKNGGTPQNIYDSMKIPIFRVAADWPQKTIHLGQASGVGIDPHGNVLVFHRGDRPWDGNTFDERDRYALQDLGPINQDTIVLISSTNGGILHQWGKNRFYMPHGLTVSSNGDVYVTDVALHQVFRFPSGKTEPDLILGKRFEPGNDDTCFCKPTDVAVLSNGNFFIADGYCNSRIIKLNAKGERISQVGHNSDSARPPRLAFNIPHALTLAEDQDLLCVADRENGRIQCLTASDLSFKFLIDASSFRGPLFSVTYSSAHGGNLFAVNGPGNEGAKVQGFVIPLRSKRVQGEFSPSDNGFNQPHDIVASKNGSQLYVVEISKPYRVWKFEEATADLHFENADGNPIPNFSVSPQGSPSDQLSQPFAVEDDSISTSVLIMLFLTAPLLILIFVGMLIRLRSDRCRRTANSNRLTDFFLPTPDGFKRLKTDESDCDNSEEEVEEFIVPKYRKSSN